jgi:16S rRNA (cytosine967-C5)-methyltransferase
LVIDLAKSSPISPARLAAFEILLRVEEGAYASILLNSKEAALDVLDRGLTHELVMGVLRWQLWLDRLIEYYSGRKASDLDLAIRVILHLGLYQLRFLSRIPDSAAVNESVNLAKFARLRSAVPFVNAVLRRATREPQVDPANGINDPIERIAVNTSHPAWLIDRWSKAFGMEETEKFARANNEPAPVAFRVVSTRADEAAVLESLRQAGGVLTRSKIANGGWRITGAGSLLSQLVNRGEVYIQDEASQLVAEVLGAESGHRVLDLCAAPGSKTTQIADHALDSASVFAGDLHEHRLRTVVSAAKLQGLRNIQTVTLNALQLLPFVEGSFDRVLVDAPCSGTGTLRRNPEIRWRISPADIDDLSARQKQLLQNAARAVKPGGRLVYSTCSVETDENEDVREAFLENNRSFDPVNIGIESLVTSTGAARTWPQKHGTDGFFITVFERKSD